VPHDLASDGANQPESEMVTIARIQTTHGRRGEVGADILTDFPERFQRGLEVLLSNGERSRRCCIEEAWFHKAKRQERVILKFQGVDTMTEAEALAGSLVQVPRSERFPLPVGQWYVSDLMGCAVLENAEVLGTVVGWDETGGVPLLRIEGQQGEILIPYAAEICFAVDAGEKEIHVRLPEGLKEVNSPGALQRERKAVNRE
jgi:16S rRNA processing protein RimM